jgi:glutaconate CoA-transferase subunit A
MEINPELRAVRSPYADGEELVAMPALALDVAFVHMNRADARGNAQYLGPDLYFDDLFLGAARRRFVSCERIVAPEDFAKAGPIQTLRVNRAMVDGVVEAPGGAHPTECPPDYPRDEEHQREYAASAKSPEAWQAYQARYLALPDEAAYQAAVRAR